MLAALALVVLVAGCTGSPAPGPPSSQASSPRSPSTSSPTGSPVPAPPPDLQVRPNFLVITTDDMRADDLRWMPRTRRLLAGTGITFENSFAPNPLCCPSRASFLTGQYSHHHRVLSHESPYGFGAFDDSHTLAVALQGVGYRTALVGKYLNGYGEQPTYSTHEDSLLYIPPGWTDWLGSTDRLWQPGELPGGGTYWYFNLTSNVNGQLENYAGRYSTDVTAEQTRSLIGEYDAEQPHRPWFIWWTPVAPHFGEPREPDDPAATPWPPGIGVTWETPARPAWVKGRFDLEITHGAGTPPNREAEADTSDKPAYVRSYPPLTVEEKAAETVVTRQRAEALWVLDGQIARTLKTLRDTGQDRSTVVVFTSDNGYYLGEHRKRQGKINLHEPSVRVPLIISGGGLPHGRRFDPATTEDLSRTIARWSGARLSAPDGIDLTPVMVGGDRGWARPVVLEGRMPELRYLGAHRHAEVLDGLNTQGIRTARWKLVKYSTGETELYDLANDPLELNSLPKGSQRAVRTGLLRLWREYAHCRGASCRVPLPPSLRADPDENRRITLVQEAERRRYYHY